MKSSGEVRAQILKTAENLFYTQGYHSTGINQIIEESSIAKASLYHHFKSKSELLYAYLEEGHNTWFAQLQQHIAGADSYREQILMMFDLRMKRQLATDYRGCPFIKVGAEVARDDEQAFALINKNKMQLKKLIEELLQNIVHEDGPLSVSELADTIYMLLEGATVTSSFQKSSEMMISARAIADKLLPLN